MIVLSAPVRAGELLGTAAPRTDPELTLSMLVDLAVDRDLGAEVAAALRDESAAIGRLASRWLPGGASIQGILVDGGLISRTGYRQWSTSLQVPLWWPGQRRSWRQVAEAAGASAREAARLHRLEVSGWIRASLAELDLAELDRALWSEELRAQDELWVQTKRAVELGERARRELLRVESARLDALEKGQRAEDVVHEATALYHRLTGLDRRPADWREVPAPSAPTETHPEWVLAREQVKRAEGLLRVARSSVGTVPSLLLGTQHEQDRGGGGLNDRIVAGITVPIGRSRDAAVDVARARLALATARRDAARLERRLAFEVERARHERALALEIAESTSARSEVARTHLLMTERAFELGEVAISEVVRARALALTARRDREAASIRVDATVSALNQALGIVP